MLATDSNRYLYILQIASGHRPLEHLGNSLDCNCLISKYQGTTLRTDAQASHIQRQYRMENSERQESPSGPTACHTPGVTSSDGCCSWVLFSLCISSNLSSTSSFFLLYAGYGIGNSLCFLLQTF